MKILVIEDSRVGRMVIRDELEEDFDLYEAENGEESRDMLKQEDIDVILLANTLTDESSYELCRTIRNDEAYRSTPIFLMGTSDEQSHYREGFEAGASGFIKKPFDREQLSKLLMHLSSRSETIRGRKILVVEDSKSVRVVLRQSLEKMGFDVVEAEEGEEGMDVLRSEKPDLISTDLEMPGVDGFEFVQTVREESSFSEIPILMLTSKEEEGIRKQARDIGVDAFLNKPFQSDQFLQAVVQVLHEDLNLSNYRIFFADDSFTARNKLQSMLENYGFQYQGFEDGSALLDAIEEDLNSHPDVFLLDLLMPGLNGIKVLENLRSKDTFDDAPVIMISSYDKPQAVVQALNAGANDFISKPFDKTEVLERIRMHLTPFTP